MCEVDFFDILYKNTFDFKAEAIFGMGQTRFNNDRSNEINHNSEISFLILKYRWNFHIRTGVVDVAIKNGLVKVSAVRRTRIVSICMGSAFLAFLNACAPDHLGEAVQQSYILSDYGISAAPYVYGNPAPYGYHTPWGQSNAGAIGYLPSDHFSPQPSLVCERSRYVCYGAGGIDYAATEKYLGSRKMWKRQKLYAPPQAYILLP